MTSEREITAEVDLCTPDGRSAQEAVGWTRRPLHHANLRGWGARNVGSTGVRPVPTRAGSDGEQHRLPGLHTVWFQEFGGTELEKTAIVPLSATWPEP